MPASASAVYPAEVNSIYHSRRESRYNTARCSGGQRRGTRLGRHDVEYFCVKRRPQESVRAQFGTISGDRLGVMPRIGVTDVTINTSCLETLDFRTNRSDTLGREVGRSIFVDKSSSRDVTRFKLHQLSGLRVYARVRALIYSFPSLFSHFSFSLRLIYISNARYTCTSVQCFSSCHSRLCVEKLCRLPRRGGEVRH